MKKIQEAIKKIELVENEIVDCASQDLETGKYQPSEIMISLNVKVDNDLFYIQYQTGTTYDYGAINTTLEAYHDGDDSDLNLFKAVGFDLGYDNDNFHNFFIDLAEKMGVQECWDKYVKENYECNEDHFGGMDANSSINEMERRIEQ